MFALTAPTKRIALSLVVVLSSTLVGVPGVQASFTHGWGTQTYSNSFTTPTYSHHTVKPATHVTVTNHHPNFHYTHNTVKPSYHSTVATTYNPWTIKPINQVVKPINQVIKPWPTTSFKPWPTTAFKPWPSKPTNCYGHSSHNWGTSYTNVGCNSHHNPKPHHNPHASQCSSKQSQKSSLQSQIDSINWQIEHLKQQQQSQKEQCDRLCDDLVNNHNYSSCGSSHHHNSYNHYNSGWGTQTYFAGWPSNHNNHWSHHNSYHSYHNNYACQRQKTQHQLKISQCRVKQNQCRVKTNQFYVKINQQKVKINQVKAKISTLDWFIKQHCHGSH